MAAEAQNNLNALISLANTFNISSIVGV